MAGDTLRAYLAALASSLTIGVIIPLMILGLMVFAAWILLSRAQASKDFNIADVLKDEAGKVSSDRLTLLATWGASTWLLSVVVFALPQHVVEAYAIYLGVWGPVAAAKSFFRHKYGVPTAPEKEGKEEPKT